MSVKTSIFGSLQLSGNDASQFVKQMQQAKSNPIAQKALDNGRELLRDFQASGRVAVRLKD